MSGTSSKSALAWQPLGTLLEKRVAHDDHLLLLIVPFIQRGTLGKLLNACRQTDGLKVITRWNSGDLLAGVSDVSVFEELQAYHVPLYVNADIHLKLAIFTSNECFVSSANVTDAGLGYSTSPNIEAGCFTALRAEDWVHVYSIIESSILVDDDIYGQAKRFVEENKRPRKEVPQLPFFEHIRKDFSLGALPATASPQELEEFYFAGAPAECDPESARRYAHDLVTYKIEEGILNDAFVTTLGQRFTTQLFVEAFVAYLRERQKLRFGESNEWIHAHCSDVPLPYRWQVKENTHILYDWLAFFFDEIEWRVPGRHSQVIYWLGDD